MQVAGVVSSIRYTNEETGYTVCDIKSDNSTLTLVGKMPLLNIGENIVATGCFVEHAVYGRQFSVESFERKMPDKEDEIRDYLSSGFIKGLGPATAEKIVERFKDKTFDIFQNEPLRLTEIKGITPEKALSFGQAFLERENMRGIVMLLSKFNISSTYAVKVWNIYGTYAETEIQKNPYLLADNDIGLSFKVCDRIAAYYGIEPYNKERLKCALLYVLNSHTVNGDTWMPKDELIEKAVKITKTSIEFVNDAFDSLLLDGRLYVESKFPDRVYPDTLIQAERFCAVKLSLLNVIFDDFSPDEIDILLLDYEKENRIYLDEIQKEAIKSALNRGVYVITGGPGTGKTTIIKALINIYERIGLSVVLTAPTGRAAKRLNEATGYEAKTIHRLLEVAYNPESDDKAYFVHDDENPLSSDVVIVDEASMIDIELMSSLLKAIPRGTRLILVGDVDQLPSVGPGKVLSDIIESGQFKVAKLTMIYRQSEESLIVTNAHLINRGQLPVINREEGDFYFIKKTSSQSTADAVVELCTQTIPERFGFDPIKDIQVLTPMRKGDTGVYRLNELLQQSLNPQHKNKPQKAWGGAIFRVGDRVMQIKNDYSLPYVITDESGRWTEGLGVYNGDLGIVIDIDLKDEILTVRFDDNRTCEYNFDQLDNLEHAYAITVHKSQGTEFPAVVIPLYSVPPVLVCRNLLYTAVTRAKSLVVLVGSTDVMEKMIANTNMNERYSGLKERLSDYAGA